MLQQTLSPMIPWEEKGSIHPDTVLSCPDQPHNLPACIDSSYLFNKCQHWHLKISKFSYFLSKLLLLYTTKFNKYEAPKSLIRFSTRLFLHEQECVFFMFHPVLEIFTLKQFHLEVISPAPQSEAHLFLSFYNFHKLKRQKITTDKVKLWKYSETFVLLLVTVAKQSGQAIFQRVLPSLLEAILEQKNPSQVSTLHYHSDIQKVNKYFVLVGKEQTENWQRLRTQICKAAQTSLCLGTPPCLPPTKITSP